MKHTEAINVIKDELDIIAGNVKTLRMIDAKLNFTSALFPNLPSAQVYRGLAVKRELKQQLDRGNSLLDSIKVLERDI
jgi:hypothetical protein